MSFLAEFIVFFTLTLNATYATLILWLLREYRSLFLRLLVWLWSTLMSGLFLLHFLALPGWTSFLRHWFYLPVTVGMVWNLLLVPALVPVLILAVLIKGRLRPAQQPVSLPGEGLTRRKFIYLLSCSAAPVGAIGLGVHGMAARHDLRVRELNVPIVGLPPELEGFTIAHVSDPHSGIFCGPYRLRIIGDAINDVKTDLVMITGDIINHSMNEFPPALEMIQKIESPHGLYLCEGNHDIIPGVGPMRYACRENHLNLLLYSNAIVPVNGRRIILGGLPWMSRGFESMPQLVNTLYPERQEGDMRILLAHHPHLFDIADGVDLVLAGHTHGGQIMLGENVGFGPLLFNYWSGLYRRGNTALVVSNGCGDWFPCRIGAPAEIGLLRLTKA